MNKMDNLTNKQNQLLFWGCFAALAATSFGFIVRTQVIGDWGVEFGLSETEKGEIFGVGLWPFCISIILFSLIVDRIGYGVSMIIAFGLHVVSAVVDNLHGARTVGNQIGNNKSRIDFDPLHLNDAEISELEAEISNEMKRDHQITITEAEREDLEENRKVKQNLLKK